MANIIYTSYLKHLLSGTINVISDNLYAMLLSGSYTPSTGHSLVSDISAHQITDPLGSYTAGGKLLTGKTMTVVGPEVVFDAGDVTWNTSTITASGVAVWASGAGASNYHLISWTELGTTSSTNGTFQIVWSNSDGIFKVGVS